MSLVPFLNKHAGQIAWLFGKGPSLSTFNFSDAGKLRFAINDVIAHVPDCHYGFANDGVARWKDVYKHGQTLFQPIRAMGEFDSRNGAIAANVVTYDDIHDDEILLKSRAIMAQKLSIRRGTLGSALQIMHVMGIKAVHLVGFDGGNSHAPGFEWKTRLRAEHYKDYNAIRDAAIDAAFLMGISLKFHNQYDHMTDDGKQFVKFTRDSFAHGVGYREGEIARFNKTTVRQLEAARAAEIYTPEHEPVIETAEMPTEEIETADAPKQKRTRKK